MQLNTTTALATALISAAIGFGLAFYIERKSGATYDFYTKVDYKNCNSPFEEKPSFSLKFLFKKETNEIFMTAELFEDNGAKKQEIQK